MDPIHVIALARPHRDALMATLYQHHADIDQRRQERRRRYADARRRLRAGRGRFDPVPAVTG